MIPRGIEPRSGSIKSDTYENKEANRVATETEKQLPGSNLSLEEIDNLVEKIRALPAIQKKKILALLREEKE